MSRPNSCCGCQTWMGKQISVSSYWRLILLLVVISVAVTTYLTLLKMDLPVVFYDEAVRHANCQHDSDVKCELQTNIFGCKKFKERTSDWKSHPQLPRQFTREEHWRMLNLLATADWLLSMGNFTYMLYAGTLLGSWLFHDFIPWDDDIDILVSHGDKDKIMNHLREFGGPEYQVVNHKEYSKFYPTSGVRSHKYKWTWPALDLGYYGENTTHVWEIEKATDERRKFAKDTVFPLHSRPLAGRWFPSPRDSYTFMKIMLSNVDKKGKLRKDLPTFKCKLGYWDHRHEQRAKISKALDCHKIYPYYPVVHVHQAPAQAEGGRGVVEVLMLDNKTLQECYVDEPSHNALHHPLSFVLMNKTKDYLP